MRLTDAEVKHVADLARLGLSEDELRLYRDQLSTILDHIAALNEVDTSAIPPTAQVLDRANVMREDEVHPSLPHHVALANAPRQRDGFFEVDAVMTGGEESES